MSEQHLPPSVPTSYEHNRRALRPVVTASDDAVTVHLSFSDIHAGLRQTARIARQEQMWRTAARCDAYADALELAAQVRAGLDGFPTIVIRCD